MGYMDMEYTQMLTDYNDVLLPADVMKILRTGRNTVYKYLAEGKIKSIKIGGKYRIPKPYLIEYMFPGTVFKREVE